MTDLEYQTVGTGKGRMTLIPESELPKFVGKRIHLSWANKGCCWVLVKLDRHPFSGVLRMHLETPVTRKTRISYADKACYTNQHDPLRIP